MRLYSELADWFHVLTPPTHYVDEAATYTRLLLEGCPEARTLLELGSGGGNNASHMKATFACTLSDLSPEMLDISRRLNPELEHIQGDMRTLRLGRTFDVVFVHDAVVYLTELEGLRQAAETAFVHTRPGGAALFVPDAIRETFVPGTDCGGDDDPDGRSLRYLEWTHDVEPGATAYRVDYAYLMSDGQETRVEYDTSMCGLFSRAEWFAAFEDAGFTVETPAMDPEIHEEQVAFLCQRPG